VARRRQASLFGEEFSRIDQLALDFHRRVRDGYEALMQAEPQRFLCIDAAHSPDDVQLAVRAALNQRAGLNV
jgi:dTMP kinase